MDSLKGAMDCFLWGLGRVCSLFFTLFVFMASFLFGFIYTFLCYVGLQSKFAYFWAWFVLISVRICGQIKKESLWLSFLDIFLYLGFFSFLFNVSKISSTLETFTTLEYFPSKSIKSSFDTDSLFLTEAYISP